MDGDTLINLLGFLSTLGELEAVKRGIGVIGTGGILGILGGGVDIGVFREVNVHWFIPEGQALEVVHCCGGLVVIPHLHKSVIWLVVQDLHTQNVSIAGEEVEDGSAADLLFV